MPIFNLYAGWIGILLGFLTGSIHGLFFHEEQWLGGYGSWARRISRLGHISLFGLGLINLTFVFTVEHLELRGRVSWPSGLLILGIITMPLTCYLSAWRPALRHFFVVPALSLLTAVVLFLIRLTN